MLSRVCFGISALLLILLGVGWADEVENSINVRYIAFAFVPLGLLFWGYNWPRSVNLPPAP